MRNLKSYDVLETIIQDANERFSPIRKQNLEKTKTIKDLCDLIDGFIHKTNAETLEVEIDEITMEIMISVKVFCANWRKILQIPPVPITKSKYMCNDSVYHITWVKSLVLASQGKIEDKFI